MKIVKEKKKMEKGKNKQREGLLPAGLLIFFASLGEKNETHIAGNLRSQGRIHLQAVPCTTVCWASSPRPWEDRLRPPRHGKEYIRNTS